MKKKTPRSAQNWLYCCVLVLVANPCERAVLALRGDSHDGSDELKQRRHIVDSTSHMPVHCAVGRHVSAMVRVGLHVLPRCVVAHVLQLFAQI
eukprot:10017-Heterococcus_DN1.PRE.2